MEPVSIILTTVGWLVSTLINKAVTALLEEWAKNAGLGKEFTALKKELTMIDAALESARRCQTKNNAVLNLLKDLQQLAYEADDLLDELDYHRIQNDFELSGGNSSSQIADSTGSSSLSSPGFEFTSFAIRSVFKFSSSISFRFTMSRRVNELVEKLHTTGENVRNALLLDLAVPSNRANLDNQATATNPRETTSRLPESVYGRNHERDSLINLSVGDEAAKRTLSIVAIVGHGGIGKTTLAQLVYNHQRVETHFNLRMWVTVSVNFDVKRLTKEILESASDSNRDSNLESITNLDKLQTTLEKRLEAKRFLLVLDDLWEDKDTSNWAQLLAPLRKGSIKGNVVMVTTRKPAVAKLDRKINSTILKGLKDNEIWSLFKYWSFGDEMHEGHKNLEHIGHQIVEKLKGNPLAAKTVGALLNRTLDETHWRRILEREEWKYEDGVHGIMPALRISYEYLPFHLQRCFSYCALFPKNYKFTQIELVNIWSAQSFLYVQGKSMEEVGEVCLKILVDSGFFEKRIYRKVVNSGFSQKKYHREVYVVHDLLHDLAQNVSLEECLSIDSEEIQAILPTTRHLSIFTEALYKLDETEKELTKVEKYLEPGKLSTLMVFGDDNSQDVFTLESVRSIFDDANSLRVLRLHTIPSEELLLSSLLNFTHLRYLQLCSNYSCKTLPMAICRLYHLEVLDVRQWKNLKELPNNFNNLINLRYFISYNLGLYSLIAGVGKLAHLQELREFRVRKEREFAIEQLRELKELRGRLNIYNIENVESTEEAKGAGLIEKTFLNSLQLSWNHRENSNVEHDVDALVLERLQPHRNLKELKITGYGGATTPTWLTSQNMLTYLKCVSLDNCVALEILPPLGQLSFLKNLELRSMSTVREIGPYLYGYGQHMAFQCLEEMILDDMPKLTKWVWNDQCQNLPALSKLSIDKCPELDLQLSGCDLEVLHLPPLSRARLTALSQTFSVRFPHLVDLRISGCPKLLQLPLLPWKNNISSIATENVGSFERFTFSDSELSIHNPNNPMAWDNIIFHNLETITSLEITSNRYLLSWENLCSLACLQKLSFSNSLVLFSFPNKGPDNKMCLQLTSLKRLKLRLCGIIGKQLSWMLQHVPVLSELLIQECQEIKSIEVETKMNEPNLITSPVVPTSQLFEGLSSLTTLRVFGSRNLKSVDLTSFSALEELQFLGCRELASLKGLQSLARLKNLMVEYCPSFADAWISASNIGFSMPLKSLHIDTVAVLARPICMQLTSLQRLTFGYEVVDLTEEQEDELLLLTSLKEMEFYRCPKLHHLPAKLHQLRSVHKLLIHYCENIKSLPENGLPKSLTKLDVHCCGDKVMKMFEEYQKQLT